MCPLPELRKSCEPKCKSFYAHYEACKERIEKKGAGDCEPYYFDWLKCIDKCVSYLSSIAFVICAQAMPQIMAKLK